MEAASSSSSSDSESSSSSSRGEGNPPIQSLEDLPSDDSVSLDSSSSEEDDDEEARNVKGVAAGSSDSSDSSSEESEDSSESDGENSDHDDDEDDIPLEERLARKRNEGLSKKTLQSIRDRKSKAIERAREKMAIIKKDVGTKEQKTKKKPSKHAPTEVSSKRKDFFQRGAPSLNSSGIGVEIGKHRYKPRDPRYVSMSGHLNQQGEEKYSFLQELLQKDIARLKSRIAARQATGKQGQRQRRKLQINTTTLEQDKDQLQLLQQQLSQQQQTLVSRAAKQAVKKRLRENVASSGKVYYPKRRELKKMELEAKFEELRKRGGDRAVDKALVKKRKKNKSRDSGFLPKKN